MTGRRALPGTKIRRRIEQRINDTEQRINDSGHSTGFTTLDWEPSHQVVMIVRYLRHFFIGALVERRILLCGLMVGAFVLTLAFSLRHDDLWRSDAAPSTRAAARRHEALATPTGE